MLDRQWDDFRIFAGSEGFLLKNMQNGGAGCISATANINPAAIDKVYREWQSPDAEDLQQSLNQIRDTAMAYPMIPGLKATVAHFTGDAQWRTVRPPLDSLPLERSNALVAALRLLDFAMPGL